MTIVFATFSGGVNALETTSKLLINKEKDTSERKNVLMIAIDDLKPLLNCYGDTIAQTPNFDRLASMGTLFTSAYCQQAVSAASRASLLTGWCPDRTRVWDLKTLIRNENPNVLCTLTRVCGTSSLWTSVASSACHSCTTSAPPNAALPAAPIHKVTLSRRTRTAFLQTGCRGCCGDSLVFQLHEDVMLHLAPLRRSLSSLLIIWRKNGPEPTCNVNMLTSVLKRALVKYMYI